MFAKIDLGAHGNIAMTDKDMGLIARFPTHGEIGREIGTKFKSAKLIEMLRTNKIEGTYEARSSVDGILRIYSYKEIADHPLYIFAGVAPEDFLAQWKKETTAIGSGLIVFWLLLYILLKRITKQLTEQKIAEAALKESREQLRTVVEKSPFSMGLVNMRGDIEYINLKAIETFGYLPQDIPNMDRWWEQAYPDKTYRDQVINQWMGLVNEALLNKHEIEKREYRVTCKDGAVKVVSIFGVWVGDKVLAVFDDITKRKQAEDALQSSELRFRNVIEKASIGIQIADVETKRIIYSNPEICRILGYTEQDLRSYLVTDLAVDDEPLKPEEDFSQHAKRELHTSERTFRRKDGSLIKMSIHSIPMEIDGRQCLVGFLSDISEKHLLDEERLKTQKLEAIGTLAGGIAHDFNNLLQGVFGYISLARLRMNERDKSIAALEEAENALHQAVNLTTQLLTFSKGGKPTKKLIDLRPIIESSAKFTLSGSRSDLRLSILEDLWQTEADEGQLGQVIQNIVLNADQSMPIGGTIMITAKNVTEGDASLPIGLSKGNYVMIEIQDTGSGIPDKYFSKIFDPYFTTKEKGSGLGLATSYSIIKNHGGMIDVRTKYGEGSTFMIYLPATVGEVQAESAEKQQPTQSKKAKVLVMDDEEIIRNLSSELLSVLGHDVEVAKHGQEALEKYQSAISVGNPFDVVILDLTIKGGMGGVETVQKLLKMDPQAKAVVSSGYSDDAVTADYLLHGFKASLKKPYNVDALKNLLDKLLVS